MPGTERQHDGQQRPGRGRSEVAEWKTHKVIADEKQQLSDRGPDLGFRVIIDQPIMEDGSERFKRVSATIAIGDRFIRLNTKALINVMDMLTEHRSAILEAVDVVHKYNDELRSKQKQRRDSRRRDNTGKATDYSGVGQGLSRFSEMSKTERRRHKKNQKDKRQHEDD